MPGLFSIMARVENVIQSSAENDFRISDPIQSAGPLAITVLSLGVHLVTEMKVSQFSVAENCNKWHVDRDETKVTRYVFPAPTDRCDSTKTGYGLLFESWQAEKMALG